MNSLIFPDLLEIILNYFYVFERKFQNFEKWTKRMLHSRVFWVTELTSSQLYPWNLFENNISKIEENLEKIQMHLEKLTKSLNTKIRSHENCE